MAKYKSVSDAVIKRLPRYYRCLSELDKKGTERISSRELSELMGFTASQIRQDLNYFGGFGQQGYGYNVGELRIEIRNILGLDKKHKLVIAGAGNFGQALANYPDFILEGFEICALFDVNPRLIGMSFRGVEVFDIDLISEVISKEKADIGVICTPDAVAKDVAAIMASNGITSIWNFAPSDIKIEGVVVENVHLNDSLYALSFRSRWSKLQELSE